MKAKLKVVVLFGGRSSEHAVSLMSAKFVLNVINREKFNVIPIGITRQGVWMSGENILQDLVEGHDDQMSPVSMLPDPTQKGLRMLKSINDGEMVEQYSEFDVIFPVLHGTFGEDGSLQGLFELAGCAYVGAGVLGSAVGMDKGVFWDVMQANDIPVVDTVLLLRSEINDDMDAAIRKAEMAGNYPLFTKPANLGSSVGISKATNRSDLMESLKEAAQYDRRMVVQKGLNVREIEVSVLGNDEPEASVCGEIIPAAEFYSYEAKYHDDRSKAVIPADIPDKVAAKIRALALKAYKVCDLAGLARVDFFIDKDSNEIYLNELNTMPGFTQISMYPRLWEASGVSNEALVEKLIELALERKADQDLITHQYQRSG